MQMSEIIFFPSFLLSSFFPGSVAHTSQKKSWRHNLQPKGLRDSSSEVWKSPRRKSIYPRLSIPSRQSSLRGFMQTLFIQIVIEDRSLRIQLYALENGTSIMSLLLELIEQ